MFAKDSNFLLVFIFVSSMKGPHTI